MITYKIEIICNGCARKLGSVECIDPKEITPQRAREFVAHLKSQNGTREFGKRHFCPTCGDSSNPSTLIL